MLLLTFGTLGTHLARAEETQREGDGVVPGAERDGRVALRLREVPAGRRRPGQQGVVHLDRLPQGHVVPEQRRG